MHFSEQHFANLVSRKVDFNDLSSSAVAATSVREALANGAAKHLENALKACSVRWTPPARTPARPSSPLRSASVSIMCEPKLKRNSRLYSAFCPGFASQPGTGL